MADQITIRIAGPYTITFEPGRRLFCNGVPTTLRYLDKPVTIGDRIVVALVDSRRIGANGKRDEIGLTADEVATMRAATEAYHAASLAEYARTHAAEIAAANRAARLATAYDLTHNEGGEGYNPYRDMAAQVDTGHDDTDA